MADSSFTSTTASTTTVPPISAFSGMSTTTGPPLSAFGQSSSTHRDPSGYVESPPSTVVKVIGTARDDINGLFGIVVSYNLERQRYLVHMTKSQSTMAFKKENLSRATMTEGYRAQWQQLKNDPRVRHKLAHYLALWRQAVAPLQLSHVVVATLITIGLLIYLSGIIKTIMAIILFIAALLIAGQDVLEKKPLHIIISNFPNRARTAMEKHIPFLQGRVSNRMAAGIMVLLIALCIQSLFFTSPSKPRRIASTETTRGTVKMEITPTGFPPIDYGMVQKYYQMGFDDATNGKDRGASLPTQQEFIESLQVTLHDSDDASTEVDANRTDSDTPADENSGEKDDGKSGDQGQHQHDEKDPKNKVMSITNAASIFYVYKTFQELGTCPHTGIWGFAQLSANMHQAVPLWRKILIFLSLYNVIRIIF